MIKHLSIFLLVLFASCGQRSTNPGNNETDTTDALNKTASVQPINLPEKTVKFLWWADKYDEAQKDTVLSIFINEEYCKTITDPERAALGYVATFIGNQCWWDGEAKDDRSNLKCKILTALNLGYQCSDTHLGFLQQWFRNDEKSLEKLEGCSTTPYTATIQDSFDEITIHVKGNKISVFFKADGINLREGDSWSWTETDHFICDNDHIQLVKADESKVIRKHVDMDE